MKRLEYERRACKVRTHCRNGADPVMVLAQVTRERYRLGQEHRSLVKRVKRIEARLSAIAAAETKLMPMIGLDRPHTPAIAAGPAAIPPGVMTLHY
jgi:hypothetical protein